MSGPEDKDAPAAGHIPEAPVYADPSLEPASEPEPKPDPKPDPSGRAPRKAPKPAKAEKPEKKRAWFARVLLVLFIVGVVIPVGLTGLYRFVPPPVTYLMLQRVAEGRGLDKQWRPLSRINPVLVQSVVASEDSRFCSHHGFDLEAIKKAMANNERRPTRIKGGSTISQQTAKNVFLWPGRSYVRKGLEAYFTVLIEVLWGKRRIMEVYLNVAEWGPGTYGAEAAAQRYFKVPASQLSRAQAARLAAVLPNPIRYKAANPGRYVAGRSRRIGAASVTVREDQLAACVFR